MSPLTESAPAAFDGKTFQIERDGARLTKQLESVKRLMADGAWRSLSDIAALAEAPEASCSSRLRDLRKMKFGSFIANRRYISKGLFHYQVLPPGEVQTRMAL